MKRLIGLAAVLMTGFALALGGAAAQGGLTDAQVESFLRAYPDVVKFADESGAKLKDRARAERRKGAPFSDAIPMLKQQGLYDKLARVVGPHGFSSPEAFAGTADRVIRAFAAQHMSEQQPQMAQQLEMARQAITNNPNIPEQQKQEMLRRMEQALGRARHMSEAPPGDVAVVKRHSQRIQQVFESTSEMQKSRARP